jgi:hypothetical protein
MARSLPVVKILMVFWRSPLVVVAAMGATVLAQA